jgi:hypothetical protein
MRSLDTLAPTVTNAATGLVHYKLEQPNGLGVNVVGRNPWM